MSLYVNGAGQLITSGGNAVSDSASVKQDQPFTLTGTGFGTKSVAAAPAVWDNGRDAAYGATSSQWNATGSKLPIAAGGIYNVQNQPPGFSPSGAVIDSASKFVKAIIAGCHLTDGSNDSNGVMVGMSFTAPNVASVVSYPFCTRFEYDYRYDPNMFNDPQTDNNTKCLAGGDTATVFGSGQYFYWEPSPISQFPISNISQANPMVVTCAMNQAGSPATVGDVISLFGICGMTQANGLYGAITAQGGSNGAFTYTIGSIDSSGFSAYQTALNISNISQSNPAVLTLSTVSGTHPLTPVNGVKTWIWIKNVVGMTQINQQTEIAATNLGGVSGAWTCDLINGQFSGVNIDSTGYTAYSSGGTVTTGGLSAPFSNSGATSGSAATTWIGSRGWRMNPLSQLQNPDAAGHGMSSLSALLMPSYAPNGWIRRKVEICWSQSTGLTPGYFRIWDNQTLVFDFVGRTDNLSPANLSRNLAMGSVYHRDRGINNFAYFQSCYYDYTGGFVSGQCAVVYAGDNPVYSSCTLLEPQPYVSSWSNTQIVFTGFNQGRFANGATVYFHILPEASSVGTAVSTSAYTITATSTPSISTASLPGATHGVAYSQSVSATGGTAPYSYYLASSSTGTSPSTNTWAVNLSTGAVTGTPSTAETDQLFITVIDANGYNGWKQLAIVVS